MSEPEEHSQSMFLVSLLHLTFGDETSRKRAPCATLASPTAIEKITVEANLKPPSRLVEALQPSAISRVTSTSLRGVPSGRAGS
jgi:hypothetical protein